MKDRFSNPGVAGIALIACAAGTLAAGHYAVALSLLTLALVCIAFFHKPKEADSTPETSDNGVQS